MTRDRTKRLGRTQGLVLQLLALRDRPPTIRDLATDWPGLTEASVRSAVNRLGDRGLVDVAGFDAIATNARTYTLTADGRRAEMALTDLPCSSCGGAGCDDCDDCDGGDDVR